MSKWVVSATSIVFAVLVLSQSPFSVGAANARLVAAVQPPQTQAPAPPPGQSHRAEMMKMHQQMMAQMKAGDAKLDQLVATMNAATGEAKIAPMAEVLNELVRQQKAMHEHMETMMQMMGGGMMGGGGAQDR
jgi:hypothetical protein